jgi:hypothetical protein
MYGTVSTATCGKDHPASVAHPLTLFVALSSPLENRLNSFYYIGQILASGIAVPMGRRSDNYSWRVPLFIQLGPPLINIACKCMPGFNNIYTPNVCFRS